MTIRDGPLGGSGVKKKMKTMSMPSEIKEISPITDRLVTGACAAIPAIRRVSAAFCLSRKPRWAAADMILHYYVSAKSVHIGIRVSWPRLCASKGPPLITVNVSKVCTEDSFEKRHSYTV